MGWSTYHHASHDWHTDGSSHGCHCVVCLLKTFSNWRGDKGTAYYCVHLCFSFSTSPGLLLGSAWWCITRSFRRSRLSWCLLGIGRGLVFAFDCTNFVYSKGGGACSALILLVFESPVWSSLLPLRAWTKTETGPHKSKNWKRLVQCSLLQFIDQSGPVFSIFSNESFIDNSTFSSLT